MKIGKTALRIEHLIVVAIALIVGAAVLFYSGDADPLLAVESGLGAGLLAYLVTYLRLRSAFRRRH